MIVNIELSKEQSNNELGELQYNFMLYKETIDQINTLIQNRELLVRTMNRIVRSSVDRSRLEREDIRDKEFPPYIVNGNLVYSLKDSVLSIDLPESKDIQSGVES
jgi:hypothetical protein